MYKQRSFLTVIGGTLLFIFAVNNLLMDAVNTAVNLKHLTSWGKQSGLDAQIFLFVRYVLLLLNAYFPIIIFFGLIFLILWKR
jgi:hypothetical protein